MTELNLGVNNIGVNGATAIAEALNVNQSVTVLNLEGNHILVEGAPPRSRRRSRLADP